MKLLGSYNEQMFHERIEMIENEITHGLKYELKVIMLYTGSENPDEKV